MRSFKTYTQMQWRHLEWCHLKWRRFGRSIQCRFILNDVISIFPLSKNISSVEGESFFCSPLRRFLFQVLRERERESYCASMAARTMILPLLVITIAASLSWVSSSTPEAASAFVKKTISSHKIVIFSKSYCPYFLFSLLHPSSWFFTAIWRSWIYLILLEPMLSFYRIQFLPIPSLFACLYNVSLILPIECNGWASFDVLPL